MIPVVLIENFRAVFYAACSLGAYEAEGLEVELKPAAELGKALQAVAAGAIRTRFAYEDCVDTRFAEQVVREVPPT